jgi:hypothetical protein
MKLDELTVVWVDDAGVLVEGALPKLAIPGGLCPPEQAVATMTRATRASTTFGARCPGTCSHRRAGNLPGRAGRAGQPRRSPLLEQPPGMNKTLVRDVVTQMLYTPSCNRRTTTRLFLLKAVAIGRGRSAGCYRGYAPLVVEY